MDGAPELLPDLVQELDAVERAAQHVVDDEIIGLLDTGMVQGFFRAVEAIHVAAHPFQQRDHGLGDQHVVVQHDEAPALHERPVARLMWSGDGLLRNPGRGGVQRQAEFEDRAAVDLGAAPDLAVQQRQCTLDDGKPQSQPPGAVALRVADLVELVEYLSDAFLRDAGAGIPDLEQHAIPAPSGADQDGAARCELDRVGNQIHHHRVDQADVAVDDQPFLSRHVQAEIDPLFRGQCGEILFQPVEYFGYIDRDELRFDHARIQLGNMQQGVEQAVERGHRLVQLLDDPVLLGGRGGQLERVDEQVCRSQRLPQVVSRSREETGLGQLLFFQLVHGLGERILRMFAFGDVVSYAQHLDHLSGIVEYRAVRPHYP